MSLSSPVDVLFKAAVDVPFIVAVDVPFMVAVDVLFKAAVDVPFIVAVDIPFIVAVDVFSKLLLMSLSVAVDVPFIVAVDVPFKVEAKERERSFADSSEYYISSRDSNPADASEVISECNSNRSSSVPSIFIQRASESITVDSH